jgi:hypothetical protein
MGARCSRLMGRPETSPACADLWRNVQETDVSNACRVPPNSALLSEMTEERPLAADIGEALVGDVDPERLEGFRFAQRILPVFCLVRALFSQNEVDTCLKLMLLHELTRTAGRWSLERIRSHTRFLDPSRVEGLVRSGTAARALRGSG